MRLTDSSVVLPKQDRGGVSGSVVSAEVDADANSERALVCVFHPDLTFLTKGY